jgi:alpha-L-fucosidase
MEKFDRVGNWYLRVKEALEDAQPCAELFADKEDMLVTRKGNTLYLHFPTDPACSGVVLDPIMTLPERAILLNNQQPLTARIERLPRGRKEAVLQLYGLPVDALTGETYVIRLDFADLDAVIAAYKKVREADLAAENS